MSPAFWPIHRKGGKWAVRPSSGPHSLKTSIPTKVLLRDQFKYATTAREAKSLIKNGKMLIDGKVRKDDRFPVGLMDVIHIPDTKEYFRVLPDHGGKLRYLAITAEEAQFKLCRIIGKTSLKAGKTQLNAVCGKGSERESRLFLQEQANSAVHGVDLQSDHGVIGDCHFSPTLTSRIRGGHNTNVDR